MKRSKSQQQSKSTCPEIRRLKRKLNYTSSSAIVEPNNQDGQNSVASSIDTRNHDVCDSCGGVGQFLCCDACPNAFHFTCVEPPMDSNDVAKLKEKWFCNECEQIQDKGKKNTSNHTGLFHTLIDDISIKNPKSYRLPNDIIHFFKDVASDKHGRYIDTSRIKQVRYKNGQVEHPDYHQLKDKSGNFRCCYYCRKTALRQPMISCDYCPLYWHLDCLNPPLASPPNPTRKWRCPNHFENIIKPLREQRKPVTMTTVNKENKMPPSAYHYYLSKIIERELGDNNHVDTNDIKTPQPPKVITENIITSKSGVVYRLPVDSFKLDFTSHVKRRKISNDDNIRRSSIPSTTASSLSSSEVNTPPPIIFNSPITSHKPIINTTTHNDTHEDVDAWLQNMALFQAGDQTPPLPMINHDDGLLSLIQAATQSSPSSPIPSTSSSYASSSAVTATDTQTEPQKHYYVNVEKYEKYLEIEQLLRQKDKQELNDIFEL